MGTRGTLGTLGALFHTEVEGLLLCLPGQVPVCHSDVSETLDLGL